MSFKIKKEIILILSILNALCCSFTLGYDIIYFDSIFYLLFDVLVLLLATFPIAYIRRKKKLKHLYSLIIIFAVQGLLALNIITFILSLIAIIISFIESHEEKGIIEKLMKQHPIIFSVLVILSGLNFLSCSSILTYLQQITYGFEMLGEVCAAIFIFFMIVACKKTYLIFKNKGDIREAFIVSLPFIIYIFYIASSLIAINIVEGYKLTSLSNILAVSIFYMAVGIFEDFLIRGLTLNILLEKYGKTKKGIWMSVFLSSLFFGLIHFSNIFTGASFQGVLIQVITATCIGCYFSAIYLRSGSVWVTAILHGVYDLAVSISSFFVVNEVVDTTAEYASSISGYSWASLGVGIFYIILSVFLLRKSKMCHVVAMVNDQKIEKDKKDGALKLLLVGLGLGFGVLICVSTFISMFTINYEAREAYAKILTETDYQEEYGLTYINDYVEYNSLSDEVKILIAISNLDDDDFVDSYSIAKAEKNVSKEAIFTYVKKEKIDNTLLDIFNQNNNINYVSVNISYKTTCNYDEELTQYTCITTNNDEDNDLKVYTDISSISIDSNANIEVLVYYIVEDTKTNTLYADANLKTVYKYDSTISDLTGGIEYDENDTKNESFWSEIEENNDGLIPTYRLSFKYGLLDDKLYFQSSEFLEESIKNNNSIKEEIIDEEIYLYNSNEYSFSYDKSYFKIEEEVNKLLIKNNDRVCLEIELLSSSKWLNIYKDNDFKTITLGDYNYYNYGNEYLIYEDGFYSLTLNTTSETEKEKLLQIISSVKFK